MKIKFLKIDNEAILPKYAHNGDACMDIHVLVNEHNKPFVFTETGEKDEVQMVFNSVMLCPQQTICFHTGLKCSTEQGWGMKMYVRSSTGIKRGLKLANDTAIIDTATYRGELIIALHNQTDTVQEVKHLDKLVQAEIFKIEDVEIEEVDKLNDTERGEGGIGSTT